ncbi:MAG: protein kinase domain-containing protein [Pyrinomonadaceae bacterium]
MTISNISHYQITGTLGRGGMGVVYKAIDQKLQRTVALKSLLPESVGDENLKRRLMSEARAASRLNHPNICTIYEVDEADGILFIAMEYVTGETLSDEIRKGPIEIERGLDIGLQIAAGLDQAHRSNIVHRDIKPANIVLPKDGPVKILDFGIARVLKQLDGESLSEAATQQKLTEAGQLMGTAAYMSPEQLNGEDVDARTDVFAFGVLLYEMLSGQPPFRGATLLQLMGSILNDEPQPLSRNNNKLPRDLDRIIAKALAKNRDQRYATMKDLRQDLLRLKDQLQRTTLTNHQESIAVLYFENLSGAGEQEYLRDGMTEDIITELSKVERLRVFPRSAVMSYRDKEVTAPEIGRHLNASHVLAGSVRHAGNRVRITAQLIESNGGHTVWAERYDRELQDVFALQDEIARAIASALSIKLSPQEEQAIARKPVDNPEAYDYYLRGRRFLRRGTKKDIQSAAEMFRHAVALEPKFALAFAGLGHAYGRIHRYYDEDPQWMQKGIDACEEAMKLEPDLAEALSARAFIFYAHEQYELAIRYARMALDRKEDCDGAYFALGSALFLTDRLHEAAELADRAIEVSGDDYNTYLPYMNVFKTLKNTEQSSRLLQQQTRVLQWQIEWAPENVRARILLAGNFASAGDTPSAVAEVEKAVATSPNDASTLYNAACTYAVLGLKQDALAMLNRAIKNGYWHFDLLARDPDFVNLYDEPQFQQLLSAEGAS